MTKHTYTNIEKLTIMQQKEDGRSIKELLIRETEVKEILDQLTFNLFKYGTWNSLIGPCVLEVAYLLLNYYFGRSSYTSYDLMCMD